MHGAGDVKKSLDVAVAEKLLATIDKIADIFWQTEKAKGMGSPARLIGDRIRHRGQAPAHPGLASSRY